MEDNKRILIAVALSLAVIFLYPVIYGRFFKKPPVKEEASQKAAKQIPLSQTQKGVAEKKAPSVATAGPEEPVTVETPLFRAVFTSRGAGVVSWKLKNYRETLTKDSAPVDIAKQADGKFSLGSRVLAAGMPEELPFVPSKKEISLSADSKEKVAFVWTSPTGVTIEKDYTFSGTSYDVEIELKAVNGGREDLSGSISTDLVKVFVQEKKKRGAYHEGPVRSVGGKVIRGKLETKTESGKEKASWLGLEDKYFLSVFIPKEGQEVIWESGVTTGDGEAIARVSLGHPFTLKPGEKAVLNYTAFVGPKEYGLLKEEGGGLEEAIEFGMFAFIARPMRFMLNFFKRYIKNYGLAIILLTFVIKVLFHPLTKHSMKSMKEMQKIQPQLAVLKERHKSDKEKLNKELMELYKRYKINPLGGCLPMLLQIPVFIGLYEVLGVAIELRHAPFALWIHDLSGKDPYYISPIVMGATMFIQQKMTPTAMDPAQAKMMLIMPVVFTFLFMNFPSGLVLYWLTNNILSIAQQYHIYREGSHKAA